MAGELANIAVKTVHSCCITTTQINSSAGALMIDAIYYLSNVSRTEYETTSVPSRSEPFVPLNIPGHLNPNRTLIKFTNLVGAILHYFSVVLLYPIQSDCTYLRLYQNRRFYNG